ncbi:MAG TPA: lamin tail domain-containing protein [Gemmatimonadaceae bacterium]|jgi:hypothetical protein|nr:lamin tail domain-containing protein [Gemmatimonadaceae bacterium]
MTQRIFAAALTVAAVACGDSGTPPNDHGVSTVDVSLAQDAIEVGQFDTAMAIARDAGGHQVAVDKVTWSSTFPGVASVFANGEINGIESGNADILATVDGRTGSHRITVSKPPVLINEVFADGDLGDGWVELYNPTGSPVDLAGWEVRPSDTGPTTYVIPAGVSIAAGGFAIIDEASLSFPLQVNGALVLLSKFRRIADNFAWTGETPGKADGRCPDGGQFVRLTRPTRNAANVC